MKKIAVINLVGLSKRILSKEAAPFLTNWMNERSLSSIDPVLPAVTCSVQSTYLTGKWPSETGVVANGWYFRDEREVKLWRQSNDLVQAEKIWDMARKKDASFTCANMFWWYNMYSTVDYSVTPRPQYLADGRKVPDCYSHPASLRDKLQEALGTFPLFNFWGPKASIKSSKWIADASLIVDKEYDPTLLLVYLPHMDYSLQKYGPDHPKSIQALKELDTLCASFFTDLERSGRELMVLSEYGITPVSQPVHINRALRSQGWIGLRNERGTELLDTGASRAFAMADHQVAHVYLNDQSIKTQVKNFLMQLEGVDMVLDKEEKSNYHLDHPRAGELVAVAKEGFWFTYYYWEDDKLAPDFARTVDIHKKPGYDPVEMFLDPKKPFIVPRVLMKLIRKKLGFRTLMNVIPLDASLVKGSHGAVAIHERDKAILSISAEHRKDPIPPIEVCDLILNKIFS